MCSPWGPHICTIWAGGIANGFPAYTISYLQTSALPYIPLHANRQGDNPVMQHRHNTTHVVACISDYQGIALVTTHESPNMTLGSLFTPLTSVLSFPPWGFWCWLDLVDRPVGGRHVNWHLLDSIVSLSHNQIGRAHV